MTRQRVGVIGLGEVAQVIHLPILEALPERFELAAVCDISPSLLKLVGDRYGVEKRYDDATQMLDAESLDCVLVLNSDEYHADCVTAALDRQVHVMVEKPMCLSLREAERIIQARDRSGCTVMVGYMRRFAPAFEAAKEALPSLGPINYVRVHDIIGRNQLIIDQAIRVERPADIPPEKMDERWSRGSAAVRDAIGDVPPQIGGAYRLLCGLGSHDLSALRELVGSPAGVVTARQWRNGEFIAALLDYGDFHVMYETGVDEQLRFDAHLEIYGQTSTLRVQYDTPYIRHFPTVLITEETRGDQYHRSVVRPHLKDPYTHELEYFHDTVTSGGTVKTGPEDFVEDLQLFKQLVGAMQAGDQ